MFNAYIEKMELKMSETNKGLKDELAQLKEENKNLESKVVELSEQPVGEPISSKPEMVELSHNQRLLEKIRNNRN